MPVISREGLAGLASVVARIAGFALALGVSLAPLMLLASGLLQLALGALVLVLVLALWARFVDRRRVGEYGLGASSANLLELLIGVAIGLSAVATMFVVSMLFSDAPATFEPAWEVAAFWRFMARMTLVGFWEELLFRGYLLLTMLWGLRPLIGDRKATLLAVFISSLLFGLAHVATAHFSLTALLVLAFNGVVFALPLLRTGRLGCSVGMHLSWNFAQASIFGFPMSGNTIEETLIVWHDSSPVWWGGGSYGPEAGAAGILGLTIMGLLACALTRRRVERETAART